jgi:uncharacterized membrane protein YqaE (UPF0057 family)
MKKFVCDKCSTEKIKEPEFTGTLCPECGRQMTLEGHTDEEPKTTGVESRIRASSKSDQGWLQYGLVVANITLFGVGILGLTLGIDCYEETADVGESAVCEILRSRVEERVVRGVSAAFFLIPIAYSIFDAILKFLNLFSSLLKPVLFVASVIVVPPVGVLWKFGFGSTLFVNIFFTLLGYLPGLIHALHVVTYYSSKEEGKEEKSIRATETSGSVYVLTNSVLSSVVKIGYTRRSADKRARELSGTGVPGQWEVAHEIRVRNPRTVEERTHRELSRYRVSDGEFFKVSPSKAASIIRDIAQ